VLSTALQNSRIDIVGGYSTTDIVNEVRQVKQNTGA